MQNQYKIKFEKMDKYYEIKIFSNQEDKEVENKLRNEFDDFYKYKYKNQITYYIKTNTNHKQFFNQFFREVLGLNYDCLFD